DQVDTAAAVRRIAWSWPLTSRSSMGAPPRTIVFGAVLAVALTGVIVWSLRRHAGPGGGRAAVPEFYARALRRLARRGLRPAPHETAREFCARVGAETPELTAPLSRLTVAYEATRFGDRPPTPAESRALRELAVRL